MKQAIKAPPEKPLPQSLARKIYQMQQLRSVLDQPHPVTMIFLLNGGTTLLICVIMTEKVDHKHLIFLRPTYL